MRVVEIFQSIDGEGLRTGLPVNFIRLARCNLRCSYCDTEYAQCAESGEEMPVEQILDKLDSSIKAVTVTGGEPLIHSDVSTLLVSLLDAGYEVNVETNGSVSLVSYQNLELSRSPHSNLFFTVDFKLPSSGHYADMHVDYNTLSMDDVVKFVVGTERDLSAVDLFLSSYRGCMAHKFISPVFGQMDPKRLVEWVLEKPHRNKIRVQVQLHKVIWAPETRGV